MDNDNIVSSAILFCMEFVGNDLNSHNIATIVCEVERKLQEKFGFDFVLLVKPEGDCLKIIDILKYIY